MTPDAKLIRMANGIADFFQSYPRDQAIAGIHDHIRSFWTPKMRQSLADAVAAGARGQGLHPLVAEAVTNPHAAETPTRKEAAGPAEVGEIGASDAG